METKSRFADMKQLHEIERAVRENVLSLAKKFGMDETMLVVNVQQLRGGFGRYAPKAWTVNDEKERDELCINPDQFCICNPAECVDTILHELTHIYCARQNPPIKDTSRNGYYHNRNFREVAESVFGLTVVKTKSSGYNTTPKGNETKLLSLNQQLPYPFDGTWYRNQKLKSTSEEEETQRNHSYRYECPNCHQSVRGTKKGIKLLCLDCHVAYKWVPKRTAKAESAETIAETTEEE